MNKTLNFVVCRTCYRIYWTSPSTWCPTCGCPWPRSWAATCQMVSNQPNIIFHLL